MPRLMKFFSSFPAIYGGLHFYLFTFLKGIGFVLLRLNLFGQRKLPIMFPLSGMLCLWARSALLLTHSM